MNLSNMKMAMASVLILALSVLYFGQAFAGAKNAPGKAVKLQQAYVWYDGQHERQIWLNPSIVAEFHAGKGNAAQSMLKSVYADAVLVSTHGTVRLWRLGSGVDSITGVRALSSANQPGDYSPVLHDGPTSTARMRALPGNIIVYLDPAWDGAAVNAWVSKHQLEIIKKLEIGPNIYLIKTGPGLEALNTANALYKSGEVVAAFPDWWKQVTTR
jgi:hypothetical protein